MKILLCVIVAFCCGYIGIAISLEYDKKLSFYQELQAFLQILSVKIAFSKDVLADCISSYIQLNKPKNKKFYSVFADMCSAGEVQPSVVESINVRLTEAEKGELYSLIKNLGTSDVFTQREIIQSGIANCSLKIESCSTLKKSKGDVYKKLGICIGLVISILIY